MKKIIYILALLSISLVQICCEVKRLSNLGNLVFALKLTSSCQSKCPVTTDENSQPFSCPQDEQYLTYNPNTLIFQFQDDEEDDYDGVGNRHYLFMKIQEYEDYDVIYANLNDDYHLEIVDCDQYQPKQPWLNLCQNKKRRNKTLKRFIMYKTKGTAVLMNCASVLDEV